MDTALAIVPKWLSCKQRKRELPYVRPPSCVEPCSLTVRGEVVCGCELPIGSHKQLHMQPLSRRKIEWCGAVHFNPFNPLRPPRFHCSLSEVQPTLICVAHTLTIASDSASFPPTFPGNTTKGSPGHLLSLAIDHTGTPGRICPTTFEQQG